MGHGIRYTITPFTAALRAIIHTDTVRAGIADRDTCVHEVLGLAIEHLGPSPSSPTHCPITIIARGAPCLSSHTHHTTVSALCTSQPCPSTSIQPPAMSLTCLKERNTSKQANSPHRRLGTPRTCRAHQRSRVWGWGGEGTWHSGLRDSAPRFPNAFCCSHSPWLCMISPGFPRPVPPTAGPPGALCQACPCPNIQRHAPVLETHHDGVGQLGSLVDR